MSKKPKPTVADRIIEKLGGLRPASRLLGFENPSTVQGWKKRGLVPAHRQQDVIDAAKSIGVKLGPKDFFNA